MNKEEAREWFRLGFECATDKYDECDELELLGLFEAAWEFVENEKAPAPEGTEAQLKFTCGSDCGKPTCNCF